MISSSSSSCGLCFLKINPTLFPHPPILNRFTIPGPPSPPPTSLNRLPIQATRRQLLLSILIAPPFFLCCESSWGEIEIDLERYTDMMEGFTLLRPSSWIKVEKAGATVLFEDGPNNVGVVVTPVRLTTLRDFGDPQFVSNKLIQAEKRKESTKDVQIVSFTERPTQTQTQNDVQVYEFEYIIDSTRGGVKRIFSAAFVASNKLYLLNIAHSDNPQKPLSNQTRIMLEQVLHSFQPLAPHWAGVEFIL